MIRRALRFGRGLARLAIKEVRERIDRRDQQPNAPRPANPDSEDLKQTVESPDADPAAVMDAKTLYTLLEKEADLVLLDCREVYEWEAGYISPCTHIPMNDMAERASELDSTRKTVVFCLHGMRSAEIATWLQHERGFEDVWSLDGGIVSWYAEYDQERIVVVRNEDH